MKVGFIGLGIMGSRMAANLQKQGFDLVVYNRSREKADHLVAGGAAWADCPAEVGRVADVLITMLSTPPVVKATALGEQGFLSTLRPGTLWVDCSTVNPAFSREMAGCAAQQGVRFVDAPVAGSKGPAENAQLVVLAGGDPADVETCRPLLEAMGRQVTYMGPVGMGAAMKMVNNLLLGQSMLAFAEALALGEALGIERARLFETLNGAPVAAPFTAGKRAKIEGGQYEADFPLAWMQKDLELASQSAYEQGLALPLANAAKEIYLLAGRAGWREADFSAVYAFLTRTEKA